MKSIRVLTYFSTVLATAGLCLAFYFGRWPDLVYLTVLLGAFWIFTHWQRLKWGLNLALVLSALFLIVATWAESSRLWILISLVVFVMSWDLGRFTQLIENVAFIPEVNNLIKNHILRLGGVLVIGFILCLLALNINFKINFDWILILVFVMFLALSQVVGYLRRS